MKKTISRMLALLTALILLMSAMCPALASAVQELGSIEDVEQMLFDAVVEIFPTSTVEQQYIYAAYYEQKGQTENVDALMATLTSEQVIAFTDYKVEHGCTCYDEAETLVCGGMEACECMCHRVDAFNVDMEELIEQLLALDIEKVREHIYMLRQGELYDHFVELGLAPSEPIYPLATAGAGALDSYTAENEIATFALTDETAEGETQTKTEQALDKYTALQDEAGDESELGQQIGDALTEYADGEGKFNDLYTQNADFSSYVLNRGSTDAGIAVVDALNEDIELYAAEQSTGFHAIESSPDNIHIELFNYNTDYLDDYTDRLGFFNGYNNYSEDKGSSSNGGTGYAGNLTEASRYYPGLKKNLVDGYPMTNYGSLDYLFSSSFSIPEEHVIDGNTGLFTKDSKGYYIYDSKDNAARYNKNTGKFTKYSNPIAPVYFYDGTAGYETADEVEAGNFLPFNSYDQVYCYDSTEGRYRLTEEVDLWFGMYMQIDFYMPKDGKIEDEEMIFDFKGDDDVYVYIDDVLVLDIGGTHGALEGSINFATGEVKHDQGGTKGELQKDYVNTTLKACFEDAQKESPIAGVTLDNFKTGSNTFADYTKHTLKFFYMDRGGTISYCRLKFNLPQLPKNSLTVKKVVEGTVTDQVEDVEYTFQLQEANGELILNKAYTKNDNTNGNTGADGKFVLKKDEEAVFQFEGADTEKTYFVAELNEGYVDHVVFNEADGVKEVIADGATPTAKVVMEPNAARLVVFTNYLKSVNFEVVKDVEQAANSEAGREYSFEAYVYTNGNTKYVVRPNGVTADGSGKYVVADTVVNNAVVSRGYTVEADGKITFSLKDGEKANIGPLPVGAKVQITETGTFKSGEAAGIVPISLYETTVTSEGTVNGTQAGKAYTASLDPFANNEDDVNDTPVITFTNIRQYFPLTIVKKGLDLEPDRYASTMFHVEGNGVDMTVAVYGDEGEGSVTINDLPAGTYSVTELTNWTWRYNLSKIEGNSTVENPSTAIGTITVDDATNVITFTNTREEIYWLDSDCYAENRFTDTGSVVKHPNN